MKQKKTENPQNDRVVDEITEIVFAMVGAVGTDLDLIADKITHHLEEFNYATERISISGDILEKLGSVPLYNTRMQKINSYMSAGNEYRKLTVSNAALANSVAAEIQSRRIKKLGEIAPLTRHAWIVRSLKHPEELEALRKTYGDGLFVIGVYTSESRRYQFLKRQFRDGEDELKAVEKLIKRDADEGPDNGHGQHTRDTFHLSDFFIELGSDADKLDNDIKRMLDLIFSNPFLTPTFDEYAMYMAFVASTRSADLSRQVGAVLARNKNIISTGANDVPTYGGGLYWPYFDPEDHQIKDVKGGRDYTRGEDPNKKTKLEIINQITEGIKDEEQKKQVINAIKGSRVWDLTEYGRVVHAEMEALLACGRTNNSTIGTSLFCTTFPCHNCAKHIIAAGVERVVYVEPYPKSRAVEFHNDSIIKGKESSSKHENKVKFEPFVGVGPRIFLNLFSNTLGNGKSISRKNNSGDIVKWMPISATLRLAPNIFEYLDAETATASIAQKEASEYESKLQTLKRGE